MARAGEIKHEYDSPRAERGKLYRPGGPDALLRVREWTGKQGPIGRFIVREAKGTLAAYRAQPSLVTEHANQEHDTAYGGYAHRQMFELVQNGADALAHAANEGSILIRLTGTHLYCADDGRPIDERSVSALMFSHLSPKRNTGEIGRFGLGFKSVLGVTNKPEFFSRSGSFRFGREYAAARIGEVCSSPGRCPVLRLAEPIDPQEEMDRDEDLRELASWAANVVRLPLKVGTGDDLSRQVRDFPPEFLLFVEHVRYLTLEDEGAEQRRSSTLEERRGGGLHLDTGKGSPAGFVSSGSIPCHRNRRPIGDRSTTAARYESGGRSRSTGRTHRDVSGRSFPR